METIITILLEYKKGNISLKLAARYIQDMITINSGKDIETCAHEYGPINWQNSCYGIQICKKCGHESRVYERD